MESSLIPGTMTGHSARAQLAESLRGQLSGLQTLAGELAEARAALPDPGGEREWRGEAHRLYRHALEQLFTLVQSASIRVDDAIQDTRHALAGLGNDGG